MLVVKIEVWPAGDRTRKREIGQMTVGNIGGDSERGDYVVHATEHPSDITGLPKGMDEQCVIKNHKRRQSAWALVGLAAVRAVAHHGMKEVRAELKEEREKKRG